MDRIRELRTDQGIDQKTLAERAGVSRSLVSRLERGMHEPSASNLKAIADALGVSIDDLFERQSA